MTASIGAGELFYAPLDTEWPDDGWIPLGVTDEGSGWTLSVDPDGSGVLDEWSSHPTSLPRTSTIAFSWPLSAMSWRTFRVLFQRTHPGARRAHRDYARRLRARSRRARR